jgi:phosphatidate cytidylyltransferase
VTEGEGRNEGEDLFEDLDKFFAPIQDVDWPESGERASEAGSETPAEREDRPETTTEDTAAFEAPIRIEDADDLEDGESAPDAGQGGLFTDVAEARPQGRSVEDEDEEGEEESGSFLFSDEDDDESEGAITEEAFAQSPSAYVELPGPDDDESAVAELVEETEGALEEPAPDLGAVEAAADHFAESVREETEGPEPGVTEEVQIAALLGEDADESGRPQPEPQRPLRVGAEGLGGPSWQEPTALEVGADHERRPGGRDVPMAFLTGLVLAGLAIGAIAIGAGPFAILAGIVVLAAQGEYYFALQKRHYQPATALGLVSGALVLAAGYYEGEIAMLAIVAMSVFATFLWYMTVPAPHRRNVVTNIALTVLGVAYIPMLAGFIFSILPIAGSGKELVLAILGLTIAYDISAFGVGYFWGSRPLAPHVSPKKSWEGAVGATLVVVAVAVGAVAPTVDFLETVGRSVGLAVVVAVFAPLGDLAESLIKRDLGIKDMGSILPGHGGVLDRIDSILFVAPAALLYLRLLQ